MSNINNVSHVLDLVKPCDNFSAVLCDPVNWWKNLGIFSDKLWFVNRIFPASLVYPVVKSSLKDSDYLAEVTGLTFYISGNVDVSGPDIELPATYIKGTTKLLEAFPASRVLAQIDRICAYGDPPIRLTAWETYGYNQSEDLNTLRAFLPPLEDKTRFQSSTDARFIRFNYPEWRVSMLWDHYVNGVEM